MFLQSLLIACSLIIQAPAQQNYNQISTVIKLEAVNHFLLIEISLDSIETKASIHQNETKITSPFYVL